ncbi:tungstate transport system substrate-binding protein [Sedimentibacter acidaminivorans]|uniref:Tungstate transport system substrate-binding protein n=1 Tax=Sedimentibacter acidaminivorans TaxID=913099 RepID=A0ABS4GHF9_9FIRM|nr:substrate-binding domain-containing protein [Sedimentibacter acidaminivorans]MBP1927134.1 tungstate transport system substrate-binding protein [Sedimentibacter acidaminivorans]
MKKTKHFQRKGLFIVLLALMMVISLVACQSTKPAPSETPSEQQATNPATEEKSIILATTTSTQDSGLLDYLLPEFKNETGITVNVVAKGTGAALELGRNGDADGLLVHAKAQEEKFVEEGYGVERFDVMYNDFVIVGPEADPAGLKTDAPNDPIKAFSLLSEKQATFISRGDDSGTHTKEKSYWEKVDITPEGDWYVSAGSGMGAVLQMASEKQGYTLTDRATYLSMKDDLDLTIVTEKNDLMYNQYGVIMVNPEKYPIKKAEMQEFINWILSDKGQDLISTYGVEEFGQPLFIPNSKK